MTLHRDWRLVLLLCAACLLVPYAAQASAEDSPRSSGWIAIPETEYLKCLICRVE